MELEIISRFNITQRQIIYDSIDLNYWAMICDSCIKILNQLQSDLQDVGKPVSFAKPVINPIKPIAKVQDGDIFVKKNLDGITKRIPTISNTQILAKPTSASSINFKKIIEPLLKQITSLKPKSRVFRNHMIHVFAVRSLTAFLVSSIKYDKYGTIVKSLPTVLSCFCLLVNNLQEYKYLNKDCLEAELLIDVVENSLFRLVDCFRGNFGRFEFSSELELRLARYL